MSNNPKKDRNKPFNREAYAARNLTGLGWTASGTETDDPVTPLGTVPNQSASAFVAPEEQSKIKTALTTQDQGVVQNATGFLASIFDYEDSQDTPIEWAWDGMWRGLGWGYDKINHGAAWAVSAAPGGIDTFTWDQANQISVGQASLAAGAKSTGNPFSDQLNMMLNPVGKVLGGMDVAGPLGQEGFDVTDPNQRKAAFEDSTVGKWASGLTDAAFIMVADPLIFAGKAAKISKLKYLDDTFQGAGGQARLDTQLADALGQTREQMSPIAGIIYDSTLINADTGSKQISRAVLAERFKGTSGTEYLVDALYNNTDIGTGQLLIKYAFGNKSAGMQLLKENPDIAMEVFRRQRAEVRSILEREPETLAKLMKKTKSNLKREDKDLANPALKASDPQGYANKLAARDRLQKTYDALSNNRLDELDDMTDPSIRKLLSAEFEAIVRKDQALATFLKDENAFVEVGQFAVGTRNLIAGGNYGFSRNTALGRAVERSRMSRATTKTQIAASRGAMRGTGVMKTVKDADGVVSQVEVMKRLKPWQVNEFNQGGFTRAVNVWRWMGEANPSGYIATKGQAALGSWKEVQAIINDVPIYQGQSRKVIVDGVESRVGGTERGEKLLNMYMDALHDSTRGDNAAALAVARLENEIWDDISKWHGVNKRASDGMRNEALTARTNLLENFKKTSTTSSNTAFWIENGKLQKAPWIESQIQNGTYMPNFKKYNEKARMYDSSGLIKRLNDSTEFAGDNATEWYNAFNEVWRPSVLLRLGYTVRNNLEGQFRAAAFAFSLDPIRYGLAQAAYAPYNAYRSFRFPGALEAAESAAVIRKANGGAAPMPRMFTKWLEREINARETQIENTIAFIKQPGNLIEDVNSETKAFMESFYKDVEVFYTQKLAGAKASGAKATEIKGYQDNIDDAIANRVRVSQITTFQRGTYEAAKENIDNIRLKGNRPATKDYKTSKYEDLAASNDELLTNTVRTLENLKLMKIVFNDSIQRRAALNDLDASLIAFRQQGAAKARVMSGTIQSPDGTVLSAAFNKDNPLLSVILSNLSADATTKAMSVSASNTFRNAFRVHQMKTYVEVKPGAEDYFVGVASALRQVSFSEIGKMAIADRSVDDIARYLLDDDEGQQILEFIVNGWNAQRKMAQAEQKAARKAANIKSPIKGRQSSLYSVGSKEDAYQIAEDVIERYQTLTAQSPELQAYMKTFRAGTKDDLENVAKGLLSKKDASGKNLYDLQPVIGNISEELGAASVRSFINQYTSAGMRWLGTYPEDAFTRAPFYGTRYNTVLNQMIKTHMANLDSGNRITMNEFNNLMVQAHQRALKDTKEWMFTIERRTNLGTYGEIAIPFISAMQNSITTVGRLLWRDPSVAVIMTRLWQAPSKMGMTDEQGNIVIPIPHNWIPDGVENALGLENMLNWKIGMNQLNLIATQIDTGTLFQFGPVVAVPAGEMMRHGFFGVTPDAPEWFASMFGKETANSIWDSMKVHTFGGYRNDKGEMQIAAPPSAIEAILPSAGKRALQRLQGESNETYARTYYANWATEYLKWRGGMREQEPTKAEIANMTNNLTMVQWATALTSAFPPRYETVIQPILDDYRGMLDNALTKDDADRMFTEKYGTDMLAFATMGMSTNITGIGNNPVKNAEGSALGIVAQANRYAPLVAKISPQLNSVGALDSLSILFTSNANDVYDGTVTAWQESNAVPGLSEMYRSKLSPEEAFQRDTKRAGWSKWLAAKTQFDARLEQQGFTSFSQSPMLDREKQQFLSQMANDPMYQGWFLDYNEFGSARTEATVLVMKAALSDSTFVADHMDDPIWQAASEYLNGRAQVENQLKIQGGAIDSIGNRNVSQWWDKFRTNLMNVPGWDVFSNRYLDGDDDPTNTGITIGSTMSGAA